MLFIYQAKNTVFESTGYDGGHRKSLIPPVTFEVRKKAFIDVNLVM